MRREVLSESEFELLRQTQANSDTLTFSRTSHLEMTLPDVNMEVLRWIKADEHTKHTPVVMLTSSKEDQDMWKCFQLGTNSYICKSVDSDQFNAVVRQLGIYWLRLNESQPPHCRSIRGMT